MIKINKGKNTLYINSENKYSHYLVKLNKIGFPTLTLIGYFINETDLYIKLEFILNENINGEYEYEVYGDNQIIDKGVAKIIKQETKTYKQYGKG